MEETKDLTSGSVFKSLISFSIPVFIAMFIQSLYSGVDLLIVGQFATTADISGVSTGSNLIHTITIVVTELAIGVTIYVGQKIGEKDKAEAGRAIGTSLILFTIIGILLSVVLVAGTEGFATLLNAPEEAFYQTCDYIRVCGFGAIFVVMYNLIGAIFRGIGDSRTPLITVGIACVCNIFIDLIFVAVLDLGAFGAALATVIAQTISVVISFMIIRKKELPFEFKKEYVCLEKRIAARELKLGTPIALQELLVGISFMFIQTVVNTLGVTASAGVGIAEKVCAFIMLIPSSYSQAISAFVAQNIGASEPDRAKKALIYGILTSLVVGTVISTFTFINGDILASIFTQEGAVILEAHDYLRAYAIDVMFVSVLFCSIGYFNGCGHTFFVMMQGLIGAICIRIPVVYFMSTLPNTRLFYIGLGTPAASIVQIVLCVGFMYYLSCTKIKQNSEL